MFMWQSFFMTGLLKLVFFFIILDVYCANPRLNECSTFGFAKF
jgi:hypothetical protein